MIDALLSLFGKWPKWAQVMATSAIVISLALATGIVLRSVLNSYFQDGYNKCHAEDVTAAAAREDASRNQILTLEKKYADIQKKLAATKKGASGPSCSYPAAVIDSLYDSNATVGDR